MNKTLKLLLGIILVSQGLLITRTAAGSFDVPTVVGPFDIPANFRGVRGTDQTKVKEVLKVMQDMFNALDSLQVLGGDMAYVIFLRKKLTKMMMDYVWVIKDPEQFKKMTEIHLEVLPEMLGQLRKDIDEKVDQEIAEAREDEKLELYDYTELKRQYF